MSTRGRKPAAAKKTVSPTRRTTPERVEILTFALVNQKGNKIKKITEKDEIELGSQISKMVYNQLEDGRIIDTQVDGTTYILSIGFNPEEEIEKDEIAEQIVDTVEAQDNRKIFLKYIPVDEETKKKKKLSRGKKKKVSPNKKVVPKTSPKKKLSTNNESMKVWMLVLSYIHDKVPKTDVFMIPKNEIDLKLQKLLLKHNNGTLDQVVVVYYELNPGLKFKTAKAVNETISNSVNKFLDGFYPYLIDEGDNKTYTLETKINLTAQL